MALPLLQGDGNALSKMPNGVNCIIDETAFIAGVERGTEKGIKEWISAGLIELFIPLYSESNFSITDGRS